MTEAGGGPTSYPLGAAPGPARPGRKLPPTSKARIDPSRLDRPLDSLPKLGRTTAARFAALGISTVGDLLMHVPFRHEAASALVPLGSVPLDQEVTVKARVLSSGVRPTRQRRLTILEAILDDGTARMPAVWYNQAYLKETFAAHPEILVRGTLTRRGAFTSFVVKRHEIISSGEEGVHTLGLVPIYPAGGDLSVRTIRAALKKAAPEALHLVDPLPSELLARWGMARKAEALLAYHFPVSLREAGAARARLAFEELLLLQLALLRRRRAEDRGRRSRPLGPPGGPAAALLRTLPYEPTGAQLRVLAEIDADLARERPMRRLLQGDVGSGKTMVATYCLVRAVESGGQAALMAPTEVLADQHAARLGVQLGALGIEVGLLKGSQTAVERREAAEALASGELSCVVGTHALIQEGVRFADLRVAVVDEQHRFGVRQREALAGTEVAVEGEAPHVLHMTATPIPRTLSLTLYGDLDLSVIDELPPGRLPVKSRVVFPHEMPRMWGFLRGELDQGRQAYVVCPLIEESPAAGQAAAVSVFEDLSRGELRDYSVRLLHGQMAAADKREAMAAFAAGEVQTLVSTTVIEVGVDVAAATVMVILGARRFGLSQLHQLRGRVGRGSDASYCFLEAGHGDQDSLDRLRLFTRTPDGFALAEADLQARGEGQLFGERQSGVGDLRVARLLRDGALLEKAREEALALEDASCEDPRMGLLLRAAEERFGGRSHLVERA